MKKCDLEESVNKCEYFDKKSKGCDNPEKCSFQVDDKIGGNNQRCVREERWYEKYHKGTRRI